jgi:hypothetical protein
VQCSASGEGGREDQGEGGQAKNGQDRQTCQVQAICTPASTRTAQSAVVPLPSTGVRGRSFVGRQDGHGMSRIGVVGEMVFQDLLQLVLGPVLQPIGHPMKDFENLLVNLTKV